jgi:hypothetical protein
MLNYFNHFSLAFGNPTDKFKRTGDIVYSHLPYLDESLTFFRNNEEELVFVVEGGDTCLYLNQNKDGFLIGDTSRVWKEFKFSNINSKIKRIFSTNLNFHHPRFSILPSGLYSNPDLVKSIQQKNLQKENLLLSNFSHHQRGAAGNERSIILEATKNLNWITRKFNDGADGKFNTSSVEELLINIAKSKFVICPISNGLDTSRLYECWLLGSIPIVKRYPFYELLQMEGFPLAIIDDWNYLNEEKMRNISQSMINEDIQKTQEKLTNEYWLNKIQNA